MAIAIFTELTLHVIAYVHSRQNWPRLPTEIGFPILFTVSWSGYSMDFIMSWALVLATVHCSVARMWIRSARTVISSVHCVFNSRTGQSFSSMALDPSSRTGAVSVHCWCRVSFIDRHLIFKDPVYGTGGPKLHDLC